MRETLFSWSYNHDLHLFGHVLPIHLTIVLTAWKFIGLFGASMFSIRWLIQAWASRKAGHPVVPLTFWYVSLVGSMLTVSYFIFGKNDMVGILNTLPATIPAFYNLYLAHTHKPKPPEALPTS